MEKRMPTSILFFNPRCFGMYICEASACHSVSMNSLYITLAILDMTIGMSMFPSA